MRLVIVSLLFGTGCTSSQLHDALVFMPSDDGGAPRDAGGTGSDARTPADATTGADGMIKDGGARDPCGLSLQCADCTTKAGCGWCATDDRCAHGSSTGPSEGTCASWAFASQACTGPHPDGGMRGDPCHASLTCADCIAKAGCGYCESTKVCASGNAMGPSRGTCADWLAISGSCMASPDAGAPDAMPVPDAGMRESCALQTTCDDCTRQPSCGWCGASASCVFGTITGPTMGTCTDWQYFNSDCTGNGTTTAMCAADTTCGDCTAAIGCGWCASSRVCVPGGAVGPDHGTCNRWEFTSADCDPCAPLLSCGDCTLQSGCGWCADKNDCEPGSSSGPTNGFCAGWSYVPSLCMSQGSPDPCEINATCGDCTQKSGCGWCENENRCETGTSIGPSTGSCATWSFVPSACGHGQGPPPVACGDNFTCLECAAVSGCGWCDDRLDCEDGNESGPAIGTCSGWAYAPSSCGGAPIDPCHSSMTCGDCASRSGCGWCASTSACASGTAAGPAEGSCPTWDWSPMSCGVDPCTTTTSCDGCIARDGCGWCESNATCETGSVTGPSAGTCASWAWTRSMCPALMDPCLANTTCAACTAVMSCGWCNSTLQCLTGNAGGPSLGMCAEWDYTAGMCP